MSVNEHLFLKTLQAFLNRPGPHFADAVDLIQLFDGGHQNAWKLPETLYQVVDDHIRKTRDLVQDAVTAG
ncbi:hypothetical protein D3C76_1855110 [compost metagenome]